MAHRETELLAIGAGPSNLALAVALEEHGPVDLAESSILVERRASVEWQPGLLLPWAKSQVAFLKDLATLRDPCSEFSFLNFLHATGRLDEFVNMERFTAYRTEISAYLKWVADNLSRVRVELGRDCARIDPRRDDAGRLTGWLTRFADGSSIGSKYLVIGTGRDPHVPPVFGALPPERVVHSSGYKQRVAQLSQDLPYRVVVVGGAQSAAEMFAALRADLPNSDVTWLMRSVSLRSAETTKFNNELYYPSYVNEFFGIRAEIREEILRELRRTNYSATVGWLLEELYDERYLDRLAGRDDRRIRTMAEVTGAREADGEAVLKVRNRRTGAVTDLRSDVVFLGTGFTPRMPALVDALSAALRLDPLTVSRSYRVAVGESTAAACYLQGVNEPTHGISDSLLSILAQRASDIVTDICRLRGMPPWAGHDGRAGSEPAVAGD